jgi:hypothetical protein
VLQHQQVLAPRHQQAQVLNGESYCYDLILSFVATATQDPQTDSVVDSWATTQHPQTDSVVDSSATSNSWTAEMSTW